MDTTVLMGGADAYTSLAEVTDALDTSMPEASPTTASSWPCVASAAAASGAVGASVAATVKNTC